MTEIYRPYATKLGICITADTPFVPSFSGICLLLILHVGTSLVIWALSWHFVYCFVTSIAVLVLMIPVITHSIFNITDYQFKFFFEDKEGWILQKGEHPGYRVSLKSAFCSKYLVILGFVDGSKSSATFFSFKRGKKGAGLFQATLYLPIFFDSLPGYEFRQLRKTLIVLSY